MASKMTKIEKGEGYIPTVDETFGKDVCQKFRKLVRSYQSLRDKLKTATTDMEGDPKKGVVGVKTQIIDLLTSSKAEANEAGEFELLLPGGKVRDDLDGWSAALIPGTRKSLSRELLLANGVSLEVIERSTVESSYVSLRITD